MVPDDGNNQRSKPWKTREKERKESGRYWRNSNFKQPGQWLCMATHTRSSTAMSDAPGDSADHLDAQIAGI
jgi:hypothetical protein